MEHEAKITIEHTMKIELPGHTQRPGNILRVLCELPKDASISDISYEANRIDNTTTINVTYTTSDGSAGLEGA